MYYPISFKIGGGVTLCHTAIRIQLAKIFKLTGAQVKREVPIPEFSHLLYNSPDYVPDDAVVVESRHSTEAIMDVVSFSLTGEKHVLDASARSLLAKDTLWWPFTTRLCCDLW